MPRISRLVAALAVAVTLAASEVDAQIQGSIADIDGRPQSGVLVELWSPLGVTAQARTDEAGRFAFSAADAAGAARIVVRRTGLQQTTIDVHPGDHVMSIRMQSPEVRLAGVTARGRREELCRGRPVDEPQARALWHAMTERYDTAASHLGRGSRRVGADEVVSVDELASADAAGAVPKLGRFVDDSTSWASWGGGVPVADFRDRVRARYGYAMRVLTSFDPAYDIWRYDDMGGGEAAETWIEPQFGALHVFRVRSRQDGETVIAFCPAAGRRELVEVEGTLTLAADTTLLRAEWHFHAPKDDEDAGGEAEYLPPGHGLPVRVLLPARDRFWRKTTGGRYFHRWHRYLRWVLSEDGNIPEFRNEPRRPATASTPR